MQAQRGGRKYKRRVPTTCSPCYTRKQKCDRQQPCGHCTKRRRPEECVYSSPSADSSSSLRGVLPMPPRGETTSRPAIEFEHYQDSELLGIELTNDAFVALDKIENRPAAFCDPASGFEKSFGYFDNSQSNTMALLRKWKIGCDDRADDSSGNASPGMLERVQQDLEQIPQRQVLDFLIQYFVNELNWMKQIVHPPSFLAQYQQWCTKERPLSAVSDIEFTVLVLRVCAYSAQFLPSPTETVERIRGIPLSDVRKICSELAERLAKPCLALDWKGSPVRVQHILFAALMSSCEGRTDKFWEQIGLASQAAQKAGLHADIYGPGDIAAQEGEREMRGRIFCCLYVLDSHLSRQLDRVPFLPDSLVADMLPKLRPVPELSSPGMDTSAPDEFTERLMQVQLGRFWRRLGSNRSVQYDPTQGEQRYERFCAEYLPTLPRAFALDPDIRWDKHRPKLAMQRQLLHVAIFDSVCWNFRPLLLLTEAQIASLPLYKRVLIQSQKIRLSMAALKELEAVTKLHAMFGGSQIRFSAIIFNTFEAAILLLCLASEAADGEMHQEEDSHEILGLQVRRHSRDEVMQEIEAALRRLRMLSDVSDMAASGAKVITQLLSQARRNIALPSTPTPTGLGSAAAWPDTFSTMLGTDYDSEISIFPEQSHESLMAGLLSDVGNQEYETDLQMSYNFPIP